MSKILNHKDLRVWQKAVDSAMRIHVLTKAFPADERYSMTDQIRRSSRSVAANIAEAWCKRRYAAAFLAKLSDAISEAAETQTWLEFALRCEYMAADEVRELDEDYNHVMAQLLTMSRDHFRWTLEPENPERSSSSLSR